MNHPKHLEAKAAQSNWLNGYQVVILRVIRAYGDGTIAHPTQGCFFNQKFPTSVIPAQAGIQLSVRLA